MPSSAITGAELVDHTSITPRALQWSPACTSSREGKEQTSWEPNPTSTS
jgi:hypothetical protein